MRNVAKGRDRPKNNTQQEEKERATKGGSKSRGSLKPNEKGVERGGGGKTRVARRKKRLPSLVGELQSQETAPGKKKKMVTEGGGGGRAGHAIRKGRKNRPFFKINWERLG